MKLFLLEVWPWNKNLLIKACYRFFLSFFKFLILEVILSNQATQLFRDFNENFTEFKNSDEKFAFSDFTCNGSFGMNSTCKVQSITTIFPLQGLLLYFFMCNTQILVIKMYFMQSNLSLMMWKWVYRFFLFPNF